MQACPNCSFENPAGANFCQNCGHPLARVCPTCGTRNAAVARFCINCGTGLVATAQPAAAARPPEVEPTPVTPAQVAPQPAAPGSGARSAEGDRRVVTILFCDVKGSTELAERLDPEEWSEIMEAVFAALIPPVSRYGGTVSRLLGDAIVAFFGAPVAHEDDPQRAILAGLEIVAGTRELREQLRRERGLEFDVRVGINTGLAVVAEVGADQRVEYTAMGDAVNLAARMEQAARPGTVQISEHTYRLVAPLFDVESLGGVRVKGKRAPVAAYRVIGPKAQPGRLRGIEGLDAPLIGREREMERLRDVAAGLRQGRGHVVCLIGEAGLGKSRLVAELRREWEAGDSPFWHESRSLSYAATRPYGAFQQLIRQLSGAGENDSPAEIREKVSRLCLRYGQSGEERARISRAFEVLLGLEPEPGGMPLEGEALKRELFEVMSLTWRTWAASAPAVLVFDDLHWADAASVELLLHLLALAEEGPILFLCAFRPDRQAPSWQIKQRVEQAYPHRSTEILLQPLSTAESNLLVDNLLTIADLPGRVRDLILQKAEGIPFFVEEVIRELIESGAIVRDEDGQRWRATMDVESIAIPDNLQALLMARIDRLEEDARRTLQLAAVIGRSFYERVLRHALQMLSEAAAQVDRHLGTFQRMDLIREASRRPELEYLFRHALTQEAAYSSILFRRRREFHRHVGEALEALFPDRVEEYAPVLAQHFYEAGDAARALPYFTRAGDAAARLYANTEAALHYGRAAEMALRAGATGVELTALYSKRGRALELSSQYEVALEHYREMERVAHERGDRRMVLASLMARATIRSTPTPVYDEAQAKKLSEEALALAGALGDREAEARILWNLMLISRFVRDMQESLDYGERSIAIARELGLREQLAYTLNDIYANYLAIGRFDRVIAALAEAQVLFRELDNLPMLVDNLATFSTIYGLAGDFERAIALSAEADEISRRTGNLWGQSYSRLSLGPLYMGRGEFGRAIEVMEECIRLGEQAGFMVPLVQTRLFMAKAYADLGDTERAFELAALARPLVEQYFPAWKPSYFGMLAHMRLVEGNVAAAQAMIVEGHGGTEPEFHPFANGVLYFADAEVAVATGDYDRAISLGERLVAPMRAYGIRALALDPLYAQGRALIALGRADEGRTALEDARAEAEALGARWHLWRILFTLSLIEAQAGNEAAAAVLHDQAREIIGYIADHTGSAALRASFLALPEVRAVLDDDSI